MEHCLSILGMPQTALANEAGETRQQINVWMASASDHACSKFAHSCRRAGLVVTGDWIAYAYGLPPTQADTALAILLSEFERLYRRTARRLRLERAAAAPPSSARSGPGR